ncbi:MAG: hypothetical protein Q7Q73_07430 [Verrucomicrobiota bacterium JB024]|nr:hypothetical protein [Verrucomicrobiota bacterium JB024]
MTKAELERAWRDPYWRVTSGNIYWIVTKDAWWVPFRPLPAQQVVARKLLREGCRRLLIPKARREGISTMINLCQLDACLHRKHFHSMIVDQRQADASDKLVNRVQKAWERIEGTQEYAGLATRKCNSEVLEWNSGSIFSANTSGRGGTAVQFEHISELGPIDFDDPKRAEEIITGALPAADEGIQVIESTAKGPFGHFKRLVTEALEVPPAHRTDKDFEVLFFAWFMDPRHVQQGALSRIRRETHEYLNEVERQMGVKLTPEQRLWYQVHKEKYGDKMLHEYPSMLSECWSAPVEGSIYGGALTKAREDGRISRWPYDSRYPVYTAWDIGAPENTFCWFFQAIGGAYYLIDCQRGGADVNLETAADWADCLRKRGYHYARHFLPHDAKARKHGGTTWQKDLMTAGIKDCDIVEVQEHTWDGVRRMLGLFSRIYFDADKVKLGIGGLELYRRKQTPQSTSEVAQYMDEAVHDHPTSDIADAFSIIGQAEDKGLISTRNPTLGQHHAELKMPSLQAEILAAQGQTSAFL